LLAFIFWRNRIHEIQGIDIPKLLQFVACIQEKYEFLPYHDIKHALEVTIKTNILIKCLNLELEDRLSAILSAYSHDVGHEGLTNSFYKASNNPIFMWSDSAALEHYHFMLALYEWKRNDFMLQCCSKKKRYIMATLKSNILATDLGEKLVKHHLYTKKLKVFNKNTNHQNRYQFARCSTNIDLLGLNVTGFSENMRMDGIKDEVEFVLETTIKFADISNITLPHNLAVSMAKGVREEFFAQGDIERKRGYNISYGMDRTNATSFAQSQYEWIGLAKPFLVEYGLFNEAAKEAINNTETNQKLYKEEMMKQT